MKAPIKKEPAADLRDYLAEERTLLAWIRTGIASMAFGLALGHFGIFVDDPHPIQRASGVQFDGLSLWLGAALIAVGVIVNLLSAWRYTRVVGELNRRRYVRRTVSKQGVIVAMFLALLGIAITLYMFLALLQPPNPLH
ncbi:putative membrane protein [Bradyrhizobium erythrophlei]|jgi:putative membrane protein|nr:putative membrane protein [Bradyrhizobium erythrophlei]